jgi:glycosyltransferase involved in cell wall biosynthesis/ribosomal protein S18 acetylase RimI-like enzyme
VRRLKQALFRLLGIDPEAAVVSFATGDPELVAAMVAEIRQLVPERRHFLVCLGEAPDLPGVSVIRVSARAPYLEARQALRKLRIGLAPVLFTSQPHPLRAIAFALAPTRILAYNAKLERHHLHWTSPIASLLFWRGVPLDRIWLRPGWLWPWRRDRTVYPTAHRAIDGRPESKARAKVAVLTPYLPYPLSHGGAVRLYYLLKHAAAEFDITLYAFTEQEPAPADLDVIRAFCHRIVITPKPRYREPRWSTLLPPEVGEYESPVMRKLLADRSAPVLQVEYTQLARYGGEVLVEHDITQDLYRQVHERRPTLATWWDYFRWRRFEDAVLRRAQHVVVMSDKDAALSHHPRATVIPNGVDLARFRPTEEPSEASLLFIGSFRHFPNVVACRFFLDDVWPKLRAQFPDLRLTIVAGPDPLLHWGERSLPVLDGVTILGYVADVKPLYDQAQVVVVPTLESAGTNVKVLEAMAMQRAVVSTSSGCAGLGLKHGESIWVADSGPDFASGVARLLLDPALRRGIAARARDIAVSQYDWSAIARKQRDLWRSLTGSPLTIRDATEADLPALAAIQSEAREAAQWQVRDYLPYHLQIAECEGMVCGFLAMRTVAPEEHEILNLGVAKAWRRQGLASRLLSETIARYPGDLYLEVRESNRSARALYECFGFRNTGIRPSYYASLDPLASPENGIVMTRRKC